MSNRRRETARNQQLESLLVPPPEIYGDVREDSARRGADGEGRGMQVEEQAFGEKVPDPWAGQA